MNNKYIYIDFDQVILNTEPRLFERKEHYKLYNHTCEQEFYSFFKIADNNPKEWDYIIRGAESLNNSVEIIRKLEQKNMNIAVLTKVHSLIEMMVKADDLRNNRKINIPIISVPPGIDKNQIIIPNKQILIDDNQDNIDKWIECGGIGYLFNPSLKENTGNKVKSLEFLLKR